MRSLLITECEIDPAKIVPILNYDGFPITANCIADMVSKLLGEQMSGADAGNFAAE